MAASKKKKVVPKSHLPDGKRVAIGGNPQAYYKEHPSWCFNNCDTEMWAFSDSQEMFWSEIFPRLKSWETQTWGDILIIAKKQNHSINVRDLNTTAQDRLSGLYIEMESIVSLRLSSTHRIYGYLTGSAFNILWYDTNHGDNLTCVCRSRKK